MSNIGIQSEADFLKSASWRTWILFLLIAFLAHLLFFLIRVNWSTSTVPPKVELQTIDPQQLEKMRKQWEKKGMVLNHDKSIPREKEAPPDAKYFSDRNSHVQKEQRARENTIIPKPRQAQPRTQSKSQAKSSAPSTPSKLGDLSKLGVPLPLQEQPKKQEQEPSQDSDSTPGGDQYIKDKNLPEGARNLLNTAESVYYSFYSRMYQAIGPIWQSRIRSTFFSRRVFPGEYSTSVDVVLDQKGNLVEIKKIHSSGIEEFDRAVDESWRKVSQFPNPPQGLLDEQKRVHTGWTFNVQVGEGSGLHYLPPERTY